MAAIAIENARLLTHLRETKVNRESLIASSFDAIIAIGPDKKINVFNRRAEELFNYPSGKWLVKV